jgi:hypothetical protein
MGQEAGRRGDGEQPFTGPGGRSRSNKRILRSFWRPWAVERSDKKVLVTMCIGEEVMKNVLTWVGRKIQWLFSNRGGCVGDVEENRSQALLNL